MLSLIAATVMANTEQDGTKVARLENTCFSETTQLYGADYSPGYTYRSDMTLLMGDDFVTQFITKEDHDGYKPGYQISAVKVCHYLKDYHVVAGA